MKSAIARFAIHHAVSINFLVVALCIAGGFAALHMPSAIFPETDFPRVVIIIQNGVMPADEMMATITRPIEESMKDIPGCQNIRSVTGRGSAEIDLFFNWTTDMPRAEQFVSGRVSQIRQQLPATATANVNRMTFSTFPIIGISLNGSSADETTPWEIARYDIQPKLLVIPGVARVELVGGHAPEYSVIVDPIKLAGLGLDLNAVTETLRRNNLVAPAGLHPENHSLYLTVVDGRANNAQQIGDLTIVTPSGAIIPIRDFATVERGPEPMFSVVTANRRDSVLLNIYSQPNASTLDIADELKHRLPEIQKDLLPGLKLTSFYDQSLLVRSSVKNVWDSIAFGLILSVLILFVFLKDWRSTLIAAMVIPITVLLTILVMKLFGLGFNLMTLGGIAAAIGLIIDDAIVVVEAICAEKSSDKNRPSPARLSLTPSPGTPGEGRGEGHPQSPVGPNPNPLPEYRERGYALIIEKAVGEILPPLLGSTLTPVVVFIPLAFMPGIAGVFFRALAVTMVTGLLTSLVLAVTLIPSLAAFLLRSADAPTSDGKIWRAVIAAYESLVGIALRNRWFTVACGVLVIAAAVVLYPSLKSDFLPPMDEGGFIIDYISPPGTSLEETDRQMRQAEQALSQIPEVESYSRRTGQALGVALVEPNTGDFLVKLKSTRKRSTQQVIDDVRNRLNTALPRIEWEFPDILSDLIGDLIWTDEPIEIKIFSNDSEVLKKQANQVAQDITDLPGVVDLNNGLIYTGSTISLHVMLPQAQHFGLTTDDIATAVNTAMLGKIASTVLEADRVLNIRVKADPDAIQRLETLRQLPLKTPTGQIIRLDQVVDVTEIPGQLELHRDDLRQDVAVTANLRGRDLGSAVHQIQQVLHDDKSLAGVDIQYGGLYEQQVESFRNLTLVLATALVLVFTVALLEFRSFREPIAIVFGAAMSVFGIVAALLITQTSLNIVTYLGAIIGMGIVHKNGLLLLDYVKVLRERGVDLREAILQAGRRRLRPVLMTSLAAGLGMLPLTRGVNLLRPLAIAVIGAICISVLLSLIVTPTVYYLIAPRHK